MSKKKKEKIHVRFCGQCWKLQDLIMDGNIGKCPECGTWLYNKTHAVGRDGVWRRKVQQYAPLKKKDK